MCKLNKTETCNCKPVHADSCKTWNCGGCVEVDVAAELTPQEIVAFAEMIRRVERERILKVLLDNHVIRVDSVLTQFFVFIDCNTMEVKYLKDLPNETPYHS